MQYQLDITLTEEDYLLFNVFHSTETPFGKKECKKGRIILICYIVVFAILLLYVARLSTFSTVIMALLELYLILNLLLIKKVIKRNIKKHIRKVAKTGKLPYSPSSRLEFYEDKLREESEGKCSEESYSTIERIYVVKDQLILIYVDAIRAYILPRQQIAKQVNLEEFISFISKQCSNIEYR